MNQRRATTLRWLAAACAAVGLIVTIVLVVLATSRPRQHIELMARAPVGCTTTLEFKHGGTFYVWEESSSNAVTIPGDCEPTATGGTFHVEFKETAGGPKVQELPPSGAPTYSVDGYSAIRAVSTIVVSDGAAIEIQVHGPDNNVNAAIGRDPRAGVASFSFAAVLAFLAGLGGMILFLVLAHKASKPTPAVATGGVGPIGYTPYGQAPQPYHPYQQAGYQTGGYQTPYQSGPPQSGPPSVGPYPQPAPYQQPGIYQPPAPYQQPGTYQQPAPYQQPYPQSGPAPQPGAFPLRPNEGYPAQQSYPPVVPMTGQLPPPPSATMPPETSPEASTWVAPQSAPPGDADTPPADSVEQQP